MPAAQADRGARARTLRLMVETATRMMQDGASPTVSEVAECAGVSRSTAYRYFPTRDAMVQAVVGRALGPVLDWAPPPADRTERVLSLFQTSFPRLMESEATFRAALRQSLEAGSAPSEGTGDGQAPAARVGGRGHRVDLLSLALAGDRARPLGPSERRLAQALSLAFGIESIVVLKDIWGLDDERVQDVVLWVASALLRAAQEEGAIL